MDMPPRNPRKPLSQNIRIECRICGVELVAYAHDAGKPAKCPECGSRIMIPDRGTRTPREEPPLQRRPPAPPPKPEPRSALRLEDEPPPDVETDAAVPPGRSRALEASAALRGGAPRPAEGHRMRARVAGWLRRAVIVVLALAVIKVFEACFASILVGAPSDLYAAIPWFRDAVRGVPLALHRLSVPRPVEIGFLRPLERFMLGLAMLLFATRLVIRTKLLDAVYVTSIRWQERTISGLVLHSLALVIQAGLLAWAASAARTPAASDGLACGLIVLTLWASALWLTSLHLVAGSEYRELTKWMINDLTFGMLIFLVVLWPGLTREWSRAGATAVLFLANSAVALHVGVSFVFARRPSRWWWHKPLSFVISFVLLVAIALLLACSR
jgi:DNA-directed RNA polymerase subunit RPC12/RpoP